MARRVTGSARLQIPDGARVRVTGPNGSGKTSLLRALAGLEAPIPLDTEPDLRVADAVDVARQAAVVHQDARDSLIGLTVAAEHRFRGLAAPDDHQDVSTLSSGEARRLALAVNDAPLLLLDEPQEGLDAGGLAMLRRRIAQHDGTVVFVDHDGRLADLATQTVHLGPDGEEPAWDLPAGDRPVWRRDAAVLEDPVPLELPALSLAPGLHAVIGPNGAGKTTALRHWAGIGAGRGDGVAWLGPHGRDLLVADRVGDLVEPTPWAGEALMDRHPLTLSGGEAQRAALAQVFSRDVQAYLLDEPEAHLDAEGRRLLRDAIAQRIESGRVVLVATHDPALIAAAATTIPLEAP